jgi:hypothetical protein
MGVFKPAASYQSIRPKETLLIPGVGLGEGVGLGLGEGDGIGEGEGNGVGEGDGNGVGEGDGTGVGEGTGVGDVVATGNCDVATPTGTGVERCACDRPAQTITHTSPN